METLSTIKGITVEIGGNVGPLQKALEGVNRDIKNTQTQLKDVEKLLKLDPSNTELLSQKQKLLSEAISDTREKLQTLKTASEQANEQLKQGTITQEQYDALQREIEETEQALKKLESQASGTNAALAKIDEIGGKFQKAGKAMTDAGKTLTTTVTAPIAALGTAAVKTAADFDEQMSKVAAISGATGKEFDDLRTKAREMGANTKFSASEAGAAFEYMAMAGWKTEDMLSGIEGIMDLAAASGEDLATTSDIVTDALTAFGMSASESGHFADILAAASSNANTNVSMMGETFKYAAPVAGALGYSAEDCALAIGMMANAGIKSSQAGTAIRSGLTRLVKPTKQVSAAMEKYGISITDSHGRMYTMDEMIQQLRKKLGGLSEAEQGAAAAAIFGTNAMSGWLAIINGSDADMNKLKTAIANCTYQVDDIAKSLETSGIAWEKYSRQSWAKGGKGTQKVTEEIINCLDKMGMSSEETVQHLVKEFGLTAEEAQTAFQTVTSGMEESTGSAKTMAARMLDNLTGQITILKSALQELMIQIGDALMPTIRKIVGAVQAFVEKMQSMDEGTRNTIIKVAAFAAAIGPALLVIGKLTSSVGGVMKAFSSFGKGLIALGSKITGASGGMGLLKSAIAAITSPVAIVIAAVAALAAAFATLWKNNEEFREKIIAIWNHLVGNFQHFTKRIVDRINSLGFNFTSIVDMLKSVWEGFCNFLAPVFTAVFRIIHNVLTGAMNKIVAILDVFIGIFKGDWNKVWDGVQRIVSNTWKTIQAVITDVVRIVRHIIDGFLGLFGTDWNTVWASVSTFFSNIWAGITSFFNNSVATIKRVWGTVSGFFSGTWENIQAVFSNVIGFFSGVFTSAKSAVQNVWDGIKGFFSGIWTAITGDGTLVVLWEKISAPFSTAKSVIETAWNSVTGFFANIWSAITGGEELKGILDAIKKPFVDAYNAIKSVWDMVTGWFSGIFGGVKNDQNLGEVEGAISSPFTNAYNSISSSFQNIKATLSTWFSGIGSAVSGVVGDVASWVSTAWNTIRGNFEGIKDNLTTWFSGIGAAVSGVVGDVASWASTAWNTIKGNFEGVKSNLTTWFSGISTAVSGVVGDVGAWASTAWNTIKTNFEGIKGQMTTWFNGIGSAVSGVVGDIASWASTAWNTIKGNFEGIKDKMTTWFSGIGSAVSGVVGDVASWATTAWNTIKGNFEGIKGQLTIWFSGVGEKVSAAVGDISSWAANAWTTIKSNLGNAGKDIVSWFGKIDLSAAVAGVSSWVDGAWKKIKDTFETAKTDIVGFFQGMDFSGIITDVSSWATTAWNGIQNAFGDVKGWFTTTFSGIGDTISKAAGDVATWATNAWEDIKGAAVSVGDWFADIFGWGNDADKTTAETEKKVAGAGVEVKNSLIQSFSGADTEVAAVFQSMLTLSQASIDQLKAAVDAAAESIKSHFTTIETDFKTTSANIGTELGLLLKGITTTLDSMKSSVSASTAEMQKLAEDAMNAISAAFTTVETDLSATTIAVGKEITTLLTGIRTTLDGIKETVSSSLAAIKTDTETNTNAISASFAKMKDNISVAVDEIGRKLAILSTGVKGVLETIRANVEAMDTVFGTFAKSAQTHGANIGNGLNNGLASSFGSLVTSVRNVMQSVNNLLGSLPKSAYVWGADICTLLANGIYSYAGRTISAAQYLAQSIRDILGFSLPKEGPLADADTYMPDFVELLASGIMDSRKKLISSVGGLAESMSKALSGLSVPSMNAGQLALAGTTTNNRTVNVGGIQVSVNGYQAQNDSDLADLVARRLNEELNRESAVWG